MTYPLSLKAYANPAAGGHHALDHKGRPANYVCALGHPERILGGQLDHVAAKKESRVVVSFHGEAFILTVNDPLEFAHYRESFLDGVLVPADKATADALNIPMHADPKAHIALSHAAAYATFEREFKRKPHGPHVPAPIEEAKPEEPVDAESAARAAAADAAKSALAASAKASADAFAAELAAKAQAPKPAPAAPSKDGSK